MSEIDECWHGNPINRCGLCRSARAREGLTISGPVSRSGGATAGLLGGETKQDVLDEVCDLLGIPHRDVSRGSSLPSEVFQTAATRVGVLAGTMPEVCEAVITKAGMPYSSEYDSRGTMSGGGSTVTLEGIQAMRTALRRLL